MTIWFCTACGTPSGSTADTCPHCGTIRPGVITQGPMPPSQPPGPMPAGPMPAGPMPAGPMPPGQALPDAPQPGMAPGGPGAATDGPPPAATPFTFPAGMPPGMAPVTGPPGGYPPEPVTAQPGTTGPMPVAQYEVMVPGQAFDGGAPAPEYAPPGYSGYQPPPPYDPNNAGYQAAPTFVTSEAYGPQPTPPGGTTHRRWWVPALVAVVVLLAIGAIATVVLVDRNGDDTAGPDPTPTGTNGTTAAPTPTRSEPPSPSPTQSSAPPRLVTTDPSVTDARAAGVADMFENYFTSINNRDFDQALTAYDPAGVINPNDARQASDFKQGISTTTDSQIVLRSIGPPSSTRPGGVLDARVTFHSNQQPGYGPKERPNEPCTAWDVTYTLSQPSGGGYKILIGKASNSAC